MRVKHAIVMGWVLALLASFATLRSQRDQPSPLPQGMQRVDVRDQGISTHVAWRAWGEPSSPRLPIVLLHGAPGDASNFSLLAPLLAERGWRVLAFDQPGFGESSVVGTSDAGHTRRINLGARANAHRILQALALMNVTKAHVVGWSNGGGTALWMSELEPSRVATLTLLGSIGVQATEGSGSYHVERAKYATGTLLVGVLPALTPHFGLLGTFDQRVGWLRNFADTDQREMEQVMRRVDARGTDALILHGAFDVLAPLRVAEATKERMPSARMLVLDANHFLPFMQAHETASILHAMASQDEAASTDARLPTRGSRRDEWTPTPRAGLQGILDRARALLVELPWFLHALFIGAATLLLPWRWLAPFVGLLALSIVGRQGPSVDPFVAMVALASGMLLRCAGARMLSHTRQDQHAACDAFRLDWSRRLRTRPLREGWRAGVLHSWRQNASRGLALAHDAPTLTRIIAWCGFVSGVFVWACVAIVLACMLVGIAEHALLPRVAPTSSITGVAWMLLAAWVVGAIASRASNLLSLRGWRWLRIWCERMFYREYWPTWTWYVMISLWLVALALRHRTILAWLAANPGVPAGGGWIGESKWAILRGLRADESVQPTPPLQGRLARSAMLPAGDVTSASARTLLALEAMQRLGLGWPIVLKPDVGERGFAVKLARSREDALTYLQLVTGDVILQEYAPGPMECGILWARYPNSPCDTPGFIYSITAKEFPIIEGDGKSTLETLIETHPRFRRQHRTFLERFAGDASRVLARGERLRLSMAGNHCQGTLFRDGSHLATPALSRAIDAIARDYGRSISSPDSLDYARFDVRYESDEQLQRGEGFLILEMNGTSAESTNIYDPQRSLAWACRTLVGQWSLLTQLGLWRIASGAPRPRWRDLLAIHRQARQQQRMRGGASISD